jgi:transposase
MYLKKNIPVFFKFSKCNIENLFQKTIEKLKSYLCTREYNLMKSRGVPTSVRLIELV